MILPAVQWSHSVLALFARHLGHSMYKGTREADFRQMVVNWGGYISKDGAPSGDRVRIISDKAHPR